jgi:nitroreductase
MELKEAIRKRKSIRKYTDQQVSSELLNDILSYAKQVKPLYPNILVDFQILTKKDIKCILPFVTNHTIVLYSEEKEGYLENAGFILQQVELYLHTLGLGACWLGMGKPTDTLKDYNKLKNVIMLTFGYPDGELTRNIDEFKRLSLEEISDKPNQKLEPARLAPSSVNSQPWYFKHVDEYIHVFLLQRGFVTVKKLERMNYIDIGIALAHLYVENPNTFIFDKIYNVETVKNAKYVGSIKL